MTLLDLADSHPEMLFNWSISQVVTGAGDGKLKDGSKCAVEFREFLRIAPINKLSEYIENVLAEKIPDGGFILQDLVNELGHRIGFEVIPGRYRGVVNKNGFDGLWSSSEGNLLVEVKTTDAYRINLDTIAAYADEFKEGRSDDRDTAMLLVVGRQDTGDLEAQIRGSKYAWDARIVSVDALLNSAVLLENLEGSASHKLFHKALFPVEYTRLDGLISLLFSTALDVERSAEFRAQSENEPDVDLGGTISPIDQKRNEIVATLRVDYGFDLNPISKAQFIGKKNAYRFCVGISRRYDRSDQQYWYAFTDTWLRFLKEAEHGYLILGCLDREKAIQIDYKTVAEVLPKLNKTEKSERTYWHITIREIEGVLNLLAPKTAECIPLIEFDVSGARNESH
jgi:hypothetical protein